MRLATQRKSLPKFNLRPLAGPFDHGFNQCIDFNNNKTDSTNTCEHLGPLQCAEIYPEVLVGMIAAILD